MKFSYLLSLIFLVGSLSAQEVRKVSSFDGLDVAGGIYVTLIKSNENKVVVNSISGDGHLVLLTDVVGSTLRIKFENKKKLWNNGNRKADVDVYYSSIEDISTSAGSKVYGDETLNARHLELDASSGSSIKLYVDIQELEVDLSSGASINLNGTADESTIDVSSGASYRGADLKTNSTQVDVSSGASAKVWAIKDLDADASSGGSVRYKGEPERTHFDASKYSGGSISRM